MLSQRGCRDPVSIVDNARRYYEGEVNSMISGEQLSAVSLLIMTCKSLYHTLLLAPDINAIVCSLICIYIYMY